jgi:hypothetical protein
MASEEVFYSARLVPEEQGAVPKQDFEVFLVEVKSDTDIGRRMLFDPVPLLRENVPDMRIGEGPDVRAQVLRVNAEIPANPVRHSAVWIVFPGSTNLVGIQYKYQE